MANTQEEEKPSKTRQWQERSEYPVASRPMTPAQIVGFVRTLADSYKCDVSEISYEFEKILDENDNDRDDCLWLMYKMKCIREGKPCTRDIFRIKLPIPEEVRRAGERARQQQAQRPRVIMPSALPSATPSALRSATPETTNSNATTEQPTATVAQPVAAPAPAVPAPKVRRPIKRK